MGSKMPWEQEKKERGLVRSHITFCLPHSPSVFQISQASIKSQPSTDLDARLHVPTVVLDLVDPMLRCDKPS